MTDLAAPPANGTAADPLAAVRNIVARAGLNDALQEQTVEHDRYNLLVDQLASQQQKVRDCDDRRKTAQAGLDERLSMLTWELEERFVVEGRTTYRIDGAARTQMTAAERDKWKKDECKRVAAPDYHAVDQAGRELAEARDNLAALEQRISMAKRFVEAATMRVRAATAKVELIATLIPTHHN